MASVWNRKCSKFPLLAMNKWDQKPWNHDEHESLEQKVESVSDGVQPAFHLANSNCNWNGNPTVIATVQITRCLGQEVLVLIICRLWLLGGLIWLRLLRWLGSGCRRGRLCFISSSLCLSEWVLWPSTHRIVINLVWYGWLSGISKDVLSLTYIFPILGMSCLFMQAKLLSTPSSQARTSICIVKREEFLL